MKIGYQASHEQFSPSELLELSVKAQEAGFQSINSSDHFHPWSERQGQSGFSFSWLGAAMYATDIPYGVVCSPGQRYHPAIVAQAVATLCEMFPGRFWIAVGSGEALNERITGEKWPAKRERNQRLFECVQVIRKLLNGEVVNHHGLITVEEAKLYTLPKEKPLIIGAAITTETAKWLGSWADGMITISKPIQELKEMIKAFHDGGGKGKPIYLKVQLSYDKDDQKALMGAYDQWRTNIFAGTVLAELWKVEQFDALGKHVQPEELRNFVNISASIEKHVDWIKAYEALGFEQIILHNVSRNQDVFIEDFGKYVLPQFVKENTRSSSKIKM